MDAQAKKRAAFRAKLNAKKQEKQRIDSPLVRYNEHDQLVCRACDVVIKSESLWPAHQASRKHHEAIEKIKASAAALNQASHSKPERPKESPKLKSESENDKSEPSAVLPKRQTSMLPPDFFDNHEIKKQRKDSVSSRDPDSLDKDSFSANSQDMEASVHSSETGISSTAKSAQARVSGYQASKHFQKASNVTVDSEAKQTKGLLPEGFFDDKDADLRARGITPVKPDVKDEYKEFEKLIQEDLQEIDDRLEEDEIDAAEMIEEAESVEQRAHRERVERLRRKQLELKASRSVQHGKGPETSHKESSPEDSSNDDEDNDNFTVDWRAKQL